MSGHEQSPSRPSPRLSRGFSNTGRRLREIDAIPPPGAACSQVEIPHSEANGHYAYIGELASPCKPSTEEGGEELSEKIVLIGDANVGKTCLVVRYCNGAYSELYKATVGVDFSTQNFLICGVPFSLHMFVRWDTAGQEKFRAMSSAYYRGAAGVIVAFDLGNRESFLRTRSWLEEVRRENRGRNFVVFLAGLKSDMYHAVTHTDAVREANAMGAEYFECTAKLGNNVEQLFNRLAVVVLVRSLQEQRASVTVPRKVTHVDIHSPERKVKETKEIERPRHRWRQCKEGSCGVM